jgi:transcriptional regulator GlxA family with amidase domain
MTEVVEHHPVQQVRAKLNVAILLFDGVEVLDFAGPYEVFARTRLIPGVASRRDDTSAPFVVFTVAKRRMNDDDNNSSSLSPAPLVIEATGGLKVVPDFDFITAPHIDLLVIPGGFGTRALLDDTVTLDWIQHIYQQQQQQQQERQKDEKATTYLCSVCTGALVLARLGLLRDQTATTHWGALDTLAALDPSIAVDRQNRVVRTTGTTTTNTGIWTSAGVSAGIDMAFDIVEELCGTHVADETAQYIEYQRRR